MDRTETLTDLVGKMRREVLGDDGVFFTMDGRRVIWFADRIEAAAKRETVTNRNGLGNAAKMRDALAAAQDLLARIDFDADSDLDDMAAPVVAKIGQALAAPPRNCDVGTAREQADRYREVELKRIAHLTRCPHAGFSAFFPKALDWANMPYEAAQKGGK